ncbi:homocysteine S-methyltransferase family protein, partial [Brenneria sp. 4F2]|nr:homocysteine S-methyltransferase family protein [Brenneria bubanii]
HYLIGTIGSYAAHVGAEYTGDYGPLPEKINFLEYFRPQLRNFNRNEAIDIIGLETISNFHEVKAILSWDDSIISKPFYVSLSVGEDGKLRDGTSLRELVSLFPVSNPN